MAKVKTFDDVADTIAAAVNKLIAGSVKRTLMKVETATLKLQRTMFQYIATNSGIINSGAAPSFPGISLPQPRYDKLGAMFSTDKSKYTYDYLRRKQKRLGTLVGGQSYYMYSGYLKRYLNGIGNPLTVFGTPTLSWEREGQRGATAFYQGNTKSGFFATFFDKAGKPTADFKALKTKLGTITVDLYPKVPGLLHTGMEMGDYFKGAPKIASRLDNYKGGRNREFMPQFMQWWLTVKAKSALRGAL